MKYRFKIIHQNKWVKDSSEFLSKMDLGFEGFGITEIIEFTSKKDLDINQIKEKIKEAIESCEGKLLHIEGGKIE